MSDYLEKRRQLWYAVLTVPKDLRDKLGLRFVKSTKEADKRKAKIIASQFVAGWKLLIEQTRGYEGSSLSEAIQFRVELAKDQSEENREGLEYYLLDRAEDLEKSSGLDKAKEFYDIATGVKTPSEQLYSQWKSQLSVSPRTSEQYSKDVKLFIDQFPIIESVNKSAVAQWIDKLSAKGYTKDTQKRILKGCRNYWKFVSRYDIKGMFDKPFGDVELTGAVNKTPREPFEPEEIVHLWKMAKNEGKEALADLIVLGAYTGARLDELCSLKIKDVYETNFRVIASKTKAGIRSVPIHSHILPVIERLKETSSDGYLIPNLLEDKFGDRSNTMSSSFSKLKIKAGHGSSKTFHSLRHTLITSLVNAGVREFHIADIVGHEKKGITGGTYTHAVNVDVKKEAIEKISFHFPDLS